MHAGHTAPTKGPQARVMIDLRLNYPLLPGQGETLRLALADLAADADRCAETLALPPYEGLAADCVAGAAWLSSLGGPAAEGAAAVAPEAVLLGTGGHHAVLTALLAVGAPGGGVVVTDPLTYPGLIAQAAMLGIRLVACPGDADGMDPDALRAICEREGKSVRLVYLMPTLHNPLGAVMPLERRRALVAVARERDFTLLDDAYGFLEAAPPPGLARLAPERAFQVVSFSKPFGPGLKLSYLVTPPAWRERAVNVIRQTVSGAAPLWAGLVTGWLADGTLARLLAAKRAEAARRQAAAREVFAGLDYAAHPTGFHGWLRLPAGADADALHAGLLADGVDTVPASAFAVERATAPAALRVALGQEPDDARREAGLRRVAQAVRALAAGASPR